MQAYPLHWPAHWPRSPYSARSKFKTSFALARDSLMREVRTMGGILPVLSTNIRLKYDGMPYANDRQPEDKGVAIYFQYKGKPMVFACDRWDTVGDNLQAVRKTIEALRGIERWGASDMMERAFKGFQALPAPGAPKSPWQVLGVPDGSSLDMCRQARNAAARIHHPDNGSQPDAGKMTAINVAFSEIERGAA